MAKKKQQIPKYIQAKIKRPQYKVGDAVCIRWLGQIKYGIVERIYERNEEARYMVNAGGTKYPCGIQIKEYRSPTADAGFVINDSGESEESIRRKATTTNKRVVKNTGGTVIRNTDKGQVSGTDVSDTDSTDAGTQRSKTTSRKASNKPSTTGTKRTASKTKSTTKKSKSKKLDNAIQKQKDFLSGFTKDKDE